MQTTEPKADLDGLMVQQTASRLDGDQPQGGSMTRRDEYEAAYFTLLRARDHGEQLARYAQLLEAERLRIQAWMDQLRTEIGTGVPPAIRRPLDHSLPPLLEAMEARLQLVIDEERHLPKQMEAQAAFILECEEEVASLKP